MHFVYILQSHKDPTKFYVGITEDLGRRISQHNYSPICSYTIKHKPWQLKTHIVFTDRNLAQEFEVYLKSHSGKAFLRKRLA